MSTIETMPEVTITPAPSLNWFTSNGEPVCTHVVDIGNKTARLHHFIRPDRTSDSWLFTFGEHLQGYGKTAAEAIHNAFGNRLDKMQSEANAAKAIAVEHGAELMRQAEACK